MSNILHHLAPLLKSIPSTTSTTPIGKTHQTQAPKSSCHYNITLLCDFGFSLTMGLYISSSDIKVLRNPLVFFLLPSYFFQDALNENVHHAKAFPSLVVVHMSFEILS
jgi:hypothetical protein